MLANLKHPQNTLSAFGHFGQHLATFGHFWQHLAKKNPNTLLCWDAV